MTDTSWALIKSGSSYTGNPVDVFPARIIKATEKTVLFVQGEGRETRTDRGFVVALNLSQEQAIKASEQIAAAKAECWDETRRERARYKDRLDKYAARAVARSAGKDPRDEP